MTRYGAAMPAQSSIRPTPLLFWRWSGPPPESRRPRTRDTARRAQAKDHPNKVRHNYRLRLLQAAFRFDRVADVEAASKHAAQAERLAQEAQARPEAGR